MYWDIAGVSTTLERVSFMRQHLGFLLNEGPFWGMGALMAWQSTRKYDPGNFFDCYHLLYVPYVEAFATLDNGFHKFREAYSGSLLLSRILDVEELFASH